MSSKVLFVDGVINIVLGMLLITFSPNVIRFLGVPEVQETFYARILGGVLFGIGIALMIEVFRKSCSGIIGLGLGGAIAINLCGGLVLGAILIFRDLAIPNRGQIFLWALVVILVGISSMEALVYLKHK
jgi:hypothetical protein